MDTQTNQIMANPKASLSALQVYIIAGCSAKLSTPPNDSACENNRVDVKKPSATLKHPRDHTAVWET